jgi:pSer/pThr/pTyr-binding forkhead associated (FHA) protein
VYDVSAPRFDTDTAQTQDAAEPVAKLVEKRTDGAKSATYNLARTTTVGRTPDNDIALDFPEVSRHHAKIVATEGGFVVTDLKSGNGTYVNDQRIDEGPLRDGDTLRFGSLAFGVEYGGGA